MWSQAASRHLLATFVVAAMLVYLSPWAERPEGDIDLILVVLSAAVFSAAAGLLVALRRLWLRQRGIPPIRFEAQSVELPAGAQSRRLRRVRYAEIQGLAVQGERDGEQLIIDTPRFSCRFPAAAFAEAGGLHHAAAVLSARIDAQPDAERIWLAMRLRHEWGQRFLARPAPATRALVILIGAIFLLQAVVLPTGAALAMLELGANIPALVWQGQWHRLVTANLLHANAVHLLSNAWFAWLIGQIVERQFGTGRYLLLLQATGIISMLVSALVMSLLATAAYSVGASGALFGMLGAQGAFIWFYGPHLPGAFRFTTGSWAMLLGLNLIVLPLVIPQLDVAAHVGGLLAGGLLGWLWCRFTPRLLELPPLSPRERAWLGLVSAAWIGALVAAFAVAS